MQVTVKVILDGFGEYTIENELEMDNWYEFTAQFRAAMDENRAEFTGVCLRQVLPLPKKRGPKA